MNCRDFLSEFEARDARLSDAATLHLQDCADCRKINVVQTRVWQLIDKFEPVVAPNDFNFHVKSKIAQARPNSFKTVGFPMLRYVLSLSVVGLIVAFVIFNGFYSVNDRNVPAIAENNSQPIIKQANPIEGKSPAPELIARTALPAEPQTPAGEMLKPEIPAVKSDKQSLPSVQDRRLIAVKTVKRPLAKNVAGAESFVGWHDNALSSSKGILPKGLQNIAPPDKNAPNSDGISATTAEQILSLLGIESVVENGRHKVKKIIPNSVAERSKIQVGDVIEAIDGETLTSEPIRAKTIEGKNLTILRGAEKHEIMLHN